MPPPEPDASPNEPEATALTRQGGASDLSLLENAGLLADAAKQSAVAPKPVATPARANVASKAPAVEASETQAVEASQAQAVEASQAQAVEASEAQAVEASEAQAVEASQALAVEASQALAVEDVEDPAVTPSKEPDPLEDALEAPSKKSPHSLAPKSEICQPSCNLLQVSSCRASDVGSPELLACEAGNPLEYRPFCETFVI